MGWASDIRDRLTTLLGFQFSEARDGRCIGVLLVTLDKFGATHATLAMGDAVTRDQLITVLGEVRALEHRLIAMVNGRFPGSL